MHLKTMSLTALLLLSIVGPASGEKSRPDHAPRAAANESCCGTKQAPLSISLETQKALDGLVAEYSTSHEVLRRKLLDRMRDVNDILATPTPDRDMLDQAVDRVVDLQGKMTRQRYDLRLRISKLTGFSHPPLPSETRAAVPECGAKDSHCPETEVP